MKINEIHSWQVERTGLADLQRELAMRIVEKQIPAQLKLVAGIDVSYNRGSDIFYAAAVVVRIKDMETVEIATATAIATFPYIPGLLSFREGPVALKVLELLESTPDVVIFDGHGKAHPRRLGLASHIGLFLDVPTIGCAKSLLIGSYREPSPRKGSACNLVDKQETIGKVLRTRDHVKPVFVSTGNNADLDSAVALVKKCCAGYRLPEPTRRAHLAVNEYRRLRTK
jgi:deoxyribonuclease V